MLRWLYFRRKLLDNTECPLDPDGDGLYDLAMEKRECNLCNEEFADNGDESRCPKCRDLPGESTPETAESDGNSWGVGCFIIAVIILFALSFAWQQYRCAAFVNSQC